MKHLLSIKFLALILVSMGLGSSLSLASEAPKIQSLNCVKAGDSKIKLFNQKELRTLFQIQASQHPIQCHEVTWKGLRFIGVRYFTRLSSTQNVSSEYKYEVFQFRNNQFVPLAEVSADGMVARWSTERDLLKLQIQTPGPKPQKAEGFIYDAQKQKLIDYKVYARKHDWKL